MVLNKIHPDQKYIDGIATNNSVVIKMIYKKFAPKVVQFITNNSGDKEDAQDVIQEIMILLFDQAKANQLQLDCPFDACFFSLCKRHWLRELQNSTHKKVTIYENVVSRNESAHGLVEQIEAFDQKQKKYRIFDNYLKDELDIDEKNSLEKRLSGDEVLRSEFENFKEVYFQKENQFATEPDRLAFVENLTKISDRYFNKKQHKTASLKPWYFAAAASVIIMFGLFFFDYKHYPNFEDYNHPESAYFTERGVSEAILKQAENNFNGKRYETAIPIFEMILKENNSDEIKYFYAVSLLQVGKYVKAENIFKELEAENSVYKEKAKWNLALSKLKQGKYDDCKAILQTISQDYEDYDQVEQLSEELE
ncbi:tetratricopeptide repeat protein [Flavobacterium sp. UW10123]|uniref:tetratricopeptide repeat protein n=1 Tax=Flavobacterium sp. UW10123 TaxID=3230800 RepID=UPI003398DCF0